MRRRRARGRSAPSPPAAPRSRGGGRRRARRTPSPRRQRRGRRVDFPHHAPTSTSVACATARPATRAAAYSASPSSSGMNPLVARASAKSCVTALVHAADAATAAPGCLAQPETSWAIEYAVNPTRTTPPILRIVADGTTRTRARPENAASAETDEQRRRGAERDARRLVGLGDEVDGEQLGQVPELADEDHAERRQRHPRAAARHARRAPRARPARPPRARAPAAGTPRRRRTGP